MALFHFHVTQVKRSAGQSAVIREMPPTSCGSLSRPSTSRLPTRAAARSSSKFLLMVQNLLLDKPDKNRPSTGGAVNGQGFRFGFRPPEEGQTRKHVSPFREILLQNPNFEYTSYAGKSFTGRAGDAAGGDHEPHPHNNCVSRRTSFPLPPG